MRTIGSRYSLFSKVGRTDERTTSILLPSEFLRNSRRVKILQMFVLIYVLVYNGNEARKMYMQCFIKFEQNTFIEMAI